MECILPVGMLCLSAWRIVFVNSLNVIIVFINVYVALSVINVRRLVKYLIRSPSCLTTWACTINFML